MNDTTISGVKVSELAAEYSTPLYVYDEEMIKQRLKEFTSAFDCTGLHTGVIYASKAFMCAAIAQLVYTCGCSIDVVSAGELYTALLAGVPAKNLFFHGNNKSPAELEYAISSGVGVIVADSASELGDIVLAAKKAKIKVRAMLRINTGISAHTHKYIMTSAPDSKFGCSLNELPSIAAAIACAQRSPYFEFAGLHSHIGSQIFAADAYIAEIQTLAVFIADLEKKYGIAVPAVNLGGGFAAYYTDEDSPIPVADICKIITDECSRQKKIHSLSFDSLYIEPGRSIVGEAGYTIYTIGRTKNSAGREYVFVDGGMSDNIRPALYGAKYRCFLVGHSPDEELIRCTIAGKCCESADVIIDEAYIPRPSPGDLLVVYTTGAYGYSMASNYNRLPRPAVVFADAGKHRLVVKRESLEDIASHDVL